MVEPAWTTAWRAAAQELQQAIRSGQQVALLCEGDASLFASCSYVLLALRQAWPDCPVSVIPGITSCSAAAHIDDILRSSLSQKPPTEKLAQMPHDMMDEDLEPKASRAAAGKLHREGSGFNA